MKKVLLTAAILFAGTLGFYSCTEEEPAEPTTNVGAQNPDDQKEPEKEPEKEEVDEEAATEKLDPIETGDNGTGCFPAFFFNNGIIGMGKGFNINNPAKGTDRCFTLKSTNQELREVTTGSTIKGIKVEEYYTRNDYDYKTVLTEEINAGAGYLNLFQMNTTVRDSLTMASSKTTERLIFVATVNFGKFDYAKDFELTKEAFAFLKEGKFSAFKEKYGTHYVYACEKSARIIVEIENKNQSTQFDNEQYDGISASAKFKGAKVDFKYDNTKNNFELQSKNDFNLKLSFEGPRIEGIKECIENAIDRKTNIVDAVHKFLYSKLESIKIDESIESKYYAKPFTKFGCDEIVWTTKKENKLSEINNSAVSALKLINMIDRDYTKYNTADLIFFKEMDLEKNMFYNTILEYCKFTYPCDITEADQKEIEAEYQKADLTEEWKKLKNDANDLIAKIETQYNQCCDLKKDVNFSDNDYSDEVADLFDEYNRLYKIGEESAFNIHFYSMILYSLSRTEEETDNRGSITITNNSKYSFNVSIQGNNIDEDKKKFKIEGNSNQVVKVGAGSCTINVEQINGWVLWPTKRSKTINVENNHYYSFSFTD